MNPQTRLLASATLLVGLAATASAQTVAHWRFEGDATGFLSDSSGNGHTLTQGGTTNATQYTLPASGAGSTFSDPIVGGASNSFAASIGAQTARLHATDNDAFTTNTFTLEAFINPTSLTSDQATRLNFIAGHFNTSSPGNRSYGLSVDGTGKLELLLSSNGSAATRYQSAFTITTGVDYYVAASVDVTNTGSNAITLYFQQLSGPGAGSLQSQSFAAGAITSIFNANSAFSIGNIANGSTNAGFVGLIDEVRLSNVRLDSNQLLVAIPEPSAFAALAGLGALGFVASRRRRRSA